LAEERLSEVATPAEILATVAVAIGRAEFERRGRPEKVLPRHFQDARVVLEDLSWRLHQQGFGVRAQLANEVSRLLSEAVEAAGPDRPASGPTERRMENH
jgi:hypothetical protein